MTTALILSQFHGVAMHSGNCIAPCVAVATKKLEFFGHKRSLPIAATDITDALSKPKRESVSASVRADKRGLSRLEGAAFESFAS